MLNKIESLSAPKIENVTKSSDTEVTQSGTQTEGEELISISFKVIGTRDKVTKYVKFFVKDIEERGLKYEQIK